MFVNFSEVVVCESLVGAERKGGGEGGQSCVNCVREGEREYMKGGRERDIQLDFCERQIF